MSIDSVRNDGFATLGSDAISVAQLGIHTGTSPVEGGVSLSEAKNILGPDFIVIGPEEMTQVAAKINQIPGIEPVSLGLPENQASVENIGYTASELEAVKMALDASKKIQSGDIQIPVRSKGFLIYKPEFYKKGGREKQPLTTQAMMTSLINPSSDGPIDKLMAGRDSGLPAMCLTDQKARWILAFPEINYRLGFNTDHLTTITRRTEAYNNELRLVKTAEKEKIRLSIDNADLQATLWSMLTQQLLNYRPKMPGLYRDGNVSNRHIWTQTPVCVRGVLPNPLQTESLAVTLAHNQLDVEPDRHIRGSYAQLEVTGTPGFIPLVKRW